jgi:hypothetical protein
MTNKKNKVEVISKEDHERSIINHMNGTLIQKELRKLWIVEGMKVYLEANKKADKEKDPKYLKTEYNWGKSEFDQHAAELTNVEKDIFTLKKYLSYIKDKKV